MNIAVVCDDRDEAALITLALQRAGMLAAAVPSADALIEHWTDHAADGIILATAQACTEHTLDQLRAVAIVPVIVVCDVISEAQQIALYAHGATMVYLRPYSIRVVASHLRALLQAASSMQLLPPSMEVGGIVLDPQQRTVSMPGQAAQRLTQLEFKLLYMLMHQHGQVLQTEALVRQLWGDSYGADAENLRKQIYRVRTKVGKERIETVKKTGYCFVASPECDEQSPESVLARAE